MKLGSALAAGNTVVLEPSPLTPLAGLALARIIDERTDIPPGVVNVVTPSGIAASKLLTTDPRIDMVSFTGSSAVGREVMAGAAMGMKRILLESGGKSAGVFLGTSPFGGFKQSGIGREGGLIGLHAYMEPKAIGVPA